MLPAAQPFVPLALHQLCERPTGSGYPGCEVFGVRKNFGFLCGDWAKADGTGGHSSFGNKRYFIDENFIGRHSVGGVLSMVNSGVHTNSSVFLVTATKLPHLGALSVSSSILEGWL